MERFFKVLAISSDTISVVSFLFLVYGSLPNAAPAVIAFVSALPFTIRLVLSLVLEIAIAYSLGAMARRLLMSELRPLSRLPFKLAVISVVSLLLVLASIYNIARLIFLDQFASIWSFVALGVVQFALLGVRRLFLVGHLNTGRWSPGDLDLVQRIFAITCGVVFLGFVIERGLIR